MAIPWGEIVNTAAQAGTSAYAANRAAAAAEGQGGYTSSNSLTEPMARPDYTTGLIQNFVLDYYGASSESLKAKTNLTTRAQNQERTVAQINSRLQNARNQGKDTTKLEQQLANNQAILDSTKAELATFSTSPAQQAIQQVEAEQRGAQQNIADYQRGAMPGFQESISGAGTKYESLQDQLLSRILGGKSFLPESYSSQLASLNTPQQFNFGDAGGFSFVPKGSAEAAKNLLGYEQGLLSQARDISSDRYSNTLNTAGLGFESGQIPFNTEYQMSLNNPEGAATILGLEDQRRAWEPMEYMRYGTTPSTSTTTNFGLTGGGGADYSGAISGLLSQLGGMFQNVDQGW